ncbi:YbjN domain-containing protein [Nocardia brasiliensis]|uniref:YbjN domain-containing protein n=1 Tax=Nocardia brasiliensis TaxID=37326 RepID=A0A6G9XZX4_NOCBR|nr:YbjN domain-containing protein [Nocardia brasiliensis]QIS06471.1 YbjN domain-containing protein [Nocardia brasiliensis]
MSSGERAPEAQATARVIEETLREREIEHTRSGADTFVVILPGERKLKTTVMLTVGKHGVRIESFVYGVAYTLDRVGDIYLVGRIATHAVTPDELDRVFGQILEAVDADFNVLLELGFAESIRKEWKWRVSRGESLKNLRAFEHLVDAADQP